MSLKFIIYQKEHRNLKYKKMYIRIKEKEIYRSLEKSHISESKKLALSRAMAYYPSMLSTSASPLTFNSPPTTPLESPPELSTKYHFEDLPEKTKTPPCAPPLHVAEEKCENECSSPHLISSPLRASPQQNSYSSADRSPPRNYNPLSPPATPSFLSRVNFEDAESDILTTRNQYRLGNVYSSLDKFNFAQELSPPIKANDGITRFHEKKEDFTFHCLQIPFVDRVIATERPYKSEPIWSQEEQIPPDDQLTTSQKIFEISTKQLSSPILAGPRKFRLRRLLETGRITKRRKRKFINVASKRLRLHESTREQTIDKSFESNENLSMESELTIGSKKNFYLLVPKKYNSKWTELIEEFCSKFNGCWMNLQEIIDPDVSHVLAEMKPDNPNLIDKVRFEHLLAVGYRKYLVSIDWLKDSLFINHLLEAECYEVRLRSESKILPSKLARETDKLLFKGMAFVCAQPFKGFSKTVLEELLAVNGAKIAKNPTELREIEECKERYCIVGEHKFYDEPKNKEALEKCLKDIPVIHYEWLFECLTLYERKPPLLYQL